ncbi:MAG: neutral/alkaline non-lysosomal ceramidase N-terminal domain-containing protein [Clostridia bacterium]|nr:neutral/alkaline non-lysosomal ceramidase N-terminal domain-containing protein [Clostridia bacterium]
MFECGFYEKEITPPLGLLIPGYFNERPAGDVVEKLYVKSIVVRSEGETVAVAVADIECMTLRVAENAAERVNKFCGMKKENILISANHTHTGGPLFTREDHPWRDAEYESYVTKLIADCITLAYKRLVPAKLTFGVGKVTNISFVRDYLMKDGSFRTNPPRTSPDIVRPVTDIDPDLPVLFVSSEDGAPLGALTCFACHQDCVDRSDYSSDFSGSLAAEMKKLYGPDFVNVFMLGTCGDINHFDVSKPCDPPDHYKKMGRILAGEEFRVINSSEPLTGSGVASVRDAVSVDRRKIAPERLAEAKHIKATVKPAVGVKIAADNTDPDQYALAMANLTLGIAAMPEKLDVTTQAVRIGDLVIYGFSGEIYSFFGKRIKKETKAKNVIVATLCNDNVSGYVPTPDLFVPGIYEAVEGSANLVPEGGNVITDHLIALGEKIL